MCWFLKLLPGDDQISLAKASHSATSESAKHLGGAWQGRTEEYLVNIIQATPVTLFQGFYLQ